MHKLNYYYYLLRDGSEDRPICQYMRFDHLIQMLEGKEYYVKRRYTFKDVSESHSDAKLAFSFAPVNSNVDTTKQRAQKRLIPYHQIVNCPTACWTLTERESFLMWKSYAADSGVRVKSTIHNFIASLGCDLSPNSNNMLICGKMNYCVSRRSTDEAHQLFDKNESFAEENEFRFYFRFEEFEKKSKVDHIVIPIDTSLMVDEILLSPFIHKVAAEKIARMIKSSYGFENVRQSKIELK